MYCVFSPRQDKNESANTRDDVGLAWLSRGAGRGETHAEHLCPLLVEMGCDVTVLVRSPYQSVEIGPKWKGVKSRLPVGAKIKRVGNCLAQLFGCAICCL